MSKNLSPEKLFEIHIRKEKYERKDKDKISFTQKKEKSISMKNFVYANDFL